MSSPAVVYSPLFGRYFSNSSFSLPLLLGSSAQKGVFGLLYHAVCDSLILAVLFLRLLLPKAAFYETHRMNRGKDTTYSLSGNTRKILSISVLKYIKLYPLFVFNNNKLCDRSIDIRSRIAMTHGSVTLATERVDCMGRINYPPIHLR